MRFSFCEAKIGEGISRGVQNCWLPLTRTFGANSLHIESSPGAEDFEPFDMRPGQIAVFDGTACAHYTLANTTERTRVSLDFRVVPGSASDGPRL